MSLELLITLITDWKLGNITREEIVNTINSTSEIH